jgi:hypothetical protein
MLYYAARKNPKLTYVELAVEANLALPLLLLL